MSKAACVPVLRAALRRRAALAHRAAGVLAPVRRRAAAAALAAAVLGPASVRAQAPPPVQQIAAAVLAAPEPMRAGAAVLGWTDDGRVVTLRRGTNALVCLADDPRDRYWSVACYHRSLEPFMARGRELLRQGIKGKEREEVRWKEVREGKLKLPYGRILYVLDGKGYDPATKTVDQPYLRWVIYTPGATTELTGIATAAREPGEPWLMFPGTVGAHIMITPPRAGAEP